MNPSIKNCLLLIFACFGLTSFAQSGHQYRMEADQKYRENDFQKAEESYRKSLIEESSVNGTFNLGNSIYQQQRYEEAIKQYLDAANSAQNNQLKSHAYHNLGNAYFNNQDFKNSIDAYKNALRLDPQDIDTKQNLALAQRKLIQQQQQQQQSQPQNENQENEQEKQEQQQQEQQQQQGEQDDGQQQQQEQEKEMEQKDLTKEEAEKLLQIIEQEEQKVQEKMRGEKKKKTKSAKDW